MSPGRRVAGSIRFSRHVGSGRPDRRSWPRRQPWAGPGAGLKPVALPCQAARGPWQGPQLEMDVQGHASQVSLLRCQEADPATMTRLASALQLAMYDSESPGTSSRLILQPARHLWMNLVERRLGCSQSIKMLSKKKTYPSDSPSVRVYFLDDPIYDIKLLGVIDS